VSEISDYDCDKLSTSKKVAWKNHKSPRKETNMNEYSKIKISHILLAIVTMCISVNNQDNMWLQIPWILSLGLLAQDAINEVKANIVIRRESKKEQIEN